MSDPKPEYFMGVDLGQQSDFSAACILVRSRVPDPERPGGFLNTNQYACRFLKRYPLGTAYPDVVADIKKLFEREPLAGGTLCVDATGVGRPICDLFDRAGLNARRRARVTITAGSSAS